jgi:hypothetical protein
VNETFEIESDFLGRYTFFLNKYWHGRANSSFWELQVDLQERFGCLVVAMISCGVTGKCTIVQCYPITEKGIVSQFIAVQDVQREIYRAVYSEGITGHSFSFELNDEQGKSVYHDMDIIPIPRGPNSQEAKLNAILFCLIDPIHLMPVVNHLANRSCQREMIAQFLWAWWVRFCVWKVDASDESPCLAAGYNESDHVTTTNWLYSAPIPKLIRRAIKESESLRRKSSNAYDEYFFSDETSHNRFAWERWFPAIPPKDFDIETASDLSVQVRSLVYWCRWVNSHHDLEKEQNAPTSPSITEKTPFISVTEWCNKQQEEISNINDRLEDLRNITANSFRAGSSILSPRVSMRIKQEQFPIDRESLFCFGFNRWLAPDGRLRTDLTNNMLSNIEFCRTLHGVSITAHYLFGEQSLTDDVIHQIMEHVARFGHDDLGIPARIDLRAHLLHAARGEPALHALKPFYRDHFFHALEVCFLGHVLLETKLEGQYLWQLVSKIIFKEESRLKVLQLWYLGALLHDIGYAMDVLNSSYKFLGFFHHSKALQHLVESFRNTTKQLSEEEELRGLGIDLEPGIEQDHGVIGSLHLKSLLKRISRDDHNLNLKEYEYAIKAIALHNLRRQQDKISFSQQPIAFLLAICDQLQEWRRPRLSFETSPNWMLSKLGGAFSDPVNLEGAFKSIITNLEVLEGDPGDINLRFNNSSKNRPHLEFIIEYDERINRNSDIFHIWLDSTLNFQRLDFEGLPLDITVSYITPLFDKHRQFYRLRDAAHETHMSFLTEWFPTKKAGGNVLSNGAVTYHCTDQEKVTLDLRALSGKVLMTRGMDTFWQRLKEWKHFNDDRDFPGDYVNVIPE